MSLDTTMSGRTSRPPFEYSSSHPMHMVGPGLLHKNLAASALSADARLARWDGVVDPGREPELYRRLLGPLSIGPRCHQSGADWIVIEHVDAPVLWQVGDPATWTATAAWLARMHRTLCAHVDDDLPLVVHDHVLMDRWCERAEAARVKPHIIAAARRSMRRLISLPVTIIHGEFYASNVLVGKTRTTGADRSASDSIGAIDVWPIDWELAGRAPGVVDLAALTSGGGLAPRTRAAMEDAYFGSAGAGLSRRDWAADLDAARLYLCLQWLGSPSSWVPPTAHRHDWARDADELAQRA